MPTTNLDAAMFFLRALFYGVAVHTTMGSAPRGRSWNKSSLKNHQMSSSSTRVRIPLPLLIGTGATIFLANAGLLVLQLVGGRLLAPFIGSSVETWTSVIGVFLTGIAMGNWLGGRLADRFPSPRTVSVLLILSGL